ncbi:alpha-N-acetylglucosaminidase [uncultured Wocania sp.]|uniref:alpha-N-acetylglucosaminidase n=1 Tax=uncultured Wocania sp. TaxID=2834404 RepID=UPI0030FA70A5
MTNQENCIMIRSSKLLLVFISVIAFWSCEEHGTSKTLKTSYDLLARLLPDHHQQFILEELKDTVNYTFEIEQGANNKIVVRGKDGVSIASGINYYLKHIAKSHVSWSGKQINLGETLPKVTHKIRKESIYKYHYGLGYCAFNYTMPWWNWERWEKEIDFMALNGVNMPLSIIGIEEVWLNFLQRFGYSSQEAKSYISGPAYTSWWLMGNLEGQGGPVTDAWIAERTQLQKRILERMKALGMTPVLPGFVGLVPSNLTDKLPEAQILDQGKWITYQRPGVLHPNDPLFDEMAKAWYEETDKLYGKINAFAGDLFHEGGKTNGLDITSIAAKVQQKMLEYNPEAQWTLQGWGGNPQKKLLDGLNEDQTIVVELCSEYFKNWEKTNGFHGKDWIFSTIIQYGGNIGLHGRIPAIADNLKQALRSGNPPIGLGTSWESIEVNDVVNDFISDMRWEKEVVDLDKWISNYAIRRYGTDSSNSQEAWNIFLNTAYGVYDGHRRPTESIFCARPSLHVKKVSAFTASIDVHYDQRKFKDAILLLLKDSDKLQDEETYKYDVVDFTRQFMANVAQIPYNEMVEAYHQNDLETFNMKSAEFLEMLQDQDELLRSETLFLLGRWINDARALATNNEQKIQNEKNARMLITTWTEEESILRDYAWREWSGLLATYYKPRWELFINELRARIKGEKPKRVDFYTFESQWVMQTWEEQSYATEPTGNQIEFAKYLLEKWGKVIDDSERYVWKLESSLDKTESPEDAR